MHTRRDLEAAFERIGINPHGTLLVHSSMKALGPVEGGADTVLDAFAGYMAPGLLVFPAHTYEPYRNGGTVFDPLTEPPCVGVLPRLFLQRAGVVRSLHPTHSLSALGRNAVEFTAGEESAATPCSRTGCWGKLYDRGAQVLFMGAPFSTNTLMHAAEEWAGIPGRIAVNPVAFTVLHPDGNRSVVNLHRHASPPELSHNYAKMERPLLAAGIAVEGRIGDAVSRLCNCRKMMDLAASFLERNPELFADDAPVPEGWY